MATAHAMRVYEQGPPEAMKWETVDIGSPGAGEVQVRHHAIGLNYIDTYHRNGLYAVPLPSGIGLEAAGVVEAHEVAVLQERQRPIRRQAAPRRNGGTMTARQ